jgi:hypothetical protein
MNMVCSLCQELIGSEPWVYVTRSDRAHNRCQRAYWKGRDAGVFRPEETSGRLYLTVVPDRIGAIHIERSGEDTYSLYVDALLFGRGSLSRLNEWLLRITGGPQ